MQRAALALAFSTIGCALTTAGPAGPLRSGTKTLIQVTPAMAYGPATATVDGVAVSGNAEVNRGGSKGLPLPVPVTAGVNQQIGSWFQIGGDLGVNDSGVAARFRLPVFEDRPLVVTVGARSGAISPYRRDSYHAAVGLEAYPALPPAAGAAHPTHLVLALGLAGGVFEHDLSLPSAFELTSDAPHGFPSEVVLRPELRLQAAVGIHWLSVTLAVQPWIVLASSDPVSTTCDQCAGPAAVTAFSQRWGLSLLLIPSIPL
ncbi:MAG TPA: hypothetical protein VHM31_01540 [Polyangia bacterium]|nr:hypothetical protein [Polyangia bacterium]